MAGNLDSDSDMTTDRQRQQKWPKSCCSINNITNNRPQYNDSVCQSKYLLQIITFTSHTSAEGHLGCEKCLQGSVNGFWALLMGYFENQLSPKYWLEAIWENQFFSFWGLLKTFSDLKKLYLALETPTLGGSYFYNFLIKAIVLKLSRAKNGYF